MEQNFFWILIPGGPVSAGVPFDLTSYQCYFKWCSFQAVSALHQLAGYKKEMFCHWILCQLLVFGQKVSSVSPYQTHFPGFSLPAVLSLWPISSPQWPRSLESKASVGQSLLPHSHPKSKVRAVHPPPSTGLICTLQPLAPRLESARLGPTGCW